MKRRTFCLIAMSCLTLCSCGQSESVSSACSVGLPEGVGDRVYVDKDSEDGFSGPFHDGERLFESVAVRDGPRLKVDLKGYRFPYFQFFESNQELLDAFDMERAIAYSPKFDYSRRYSQDFFLDYSLVFVLVYGCRDGIWPGVITISDSAIQTSFYFEEIGWDDVATPWSLLYPVQKSLLPNVTNLSFSINAIKVTTHGCAV